MHIREYQKNDYAAVKEILSENNLFDPVWDREENLQKIIHKDPEGVLVAEIDGKVVGNIYFFDNGWEASIYRLAVKKEYQKQGIATQLLTEVEKRLKKRNVHEVMGFFAVNNKELEKYYAKRGFTIGNTFKCIWKKI